MVRRIARYALASNRSMKRFPLVVQVARNVERPPISPALVVQAPRILPVAIGLRQTAPRTAPPTCS